MELKEVRQKLVDLPQNIKDCSMEIYKTDNSISEKEALMSLVELRVSRDVLKDEKVTNERARKVEITTKCNNDEEMKKLMEESKKLRLQNENKKIDLKFLYNTQNNLRAIIKLEEVMKLDS